jgi:tetratricopeptide (TPR) repeat protein
MGTARPAVSVAQRRHALALYTRAIAVDPLHVEGYLARAHTRKTLRDEDGARKDAEAALRLRPADPMAYLSMAPAFPRPVQRKILRAGMARAVPGSWEHLYLGLNAALTYWYEGRFDLQVRALRRLLGRFAARGKRHFVGHLHYQVGSALQALGKHRAAEREFRAAARAKETTELASDAVVRSRIYQGDLDGALAELRGCAKQLKPDEVTIKRAYITALMPDSAPPLPEEIRRASQTPDNEHYEGFMNGVVLARAGRADLARPRLRRLIKLWESNPSEWGVSLRWEIAKAKELLGQPTRVSY